MSELSVLELEAQHSELLPEREALGVVMGPISHSRFSTHDTHSTFSNKGADTHDTHSTFSNKGADTHSTNHRVNFGTERH
jgi:hypothetical protein